MVCLNAATGRMYLDDGYLAGVVEVPPRGGNVAEFFVTLVARCQYLVNTTMALNSIFDVRQQQSIKS